MSTENKTQLQTNNTSLASLTDRVLAAKDTAAALPDAGGGGGLQFATGTLSNLSLLNGNPIVVTGLSFKPKYVFLFTTSGKTISDVNNYVLGAVLDSVNGVSYINYSWKSTSTVKNYIISSSSSSLSITATDDGFILSSISSGYYGMGNYIWYALG